MKYQAFPPGTKVHTHHLGETDVLLYGSSNLAKRGKVSFPQNLTNMPFVLPPVGSPIRKQLDAWFVKHNIRPQIKAEVSDAGLLRALGSGGRGIFAVRSALKAEVEELRDVQQIGRCAGLSEKYYAVTIEKRLHHPGVAAIIDQAKNKLNSPRK